MEVKRLHIGGLHPEVTESELQERFSKFGSIDGVQIKVRKGFDDASSKAFAYLNIKATEADIKKCMKVFDKTKWKGHELRIQPAKENFLSKLEKERTIPGENEEKVPDEEMPSPIKPFEMEVKGPPGTKVPGMEDWVVGKYGRILPVVNLKKEGTKYPKKIDPSKYVHKVKRFDAEREEVPEGAPNLLTWELKEMVDEITQKRKGDFKEWKPKTKQRKTELNYRLEDVLKKTSAKYIFAEENHGDFEIVNPDNDPTRADKTELEPPSVDLSRFASDSESDNEEGNKKLIPENKNLTNMKYTKPLGKKQGGVLLKEFKGIGNLSKTAVVDSSVKSTDKQKVKKVEGKKDKSKDSAVLKASVSKKVKSNDNAKKSIILATNKSKKNLLVPPSSNVNMGQLNTLSEFASGVSLSFHMKKPATSNSNDEMNDNLSFSDQSEVEDVEPDGYDPFSIFKFGVNKSRNVTNKNTTKGSDKPGGNIDSIKMNGTEKAEDMDVNEDETNLLDDPDRTVKSDSSSSDDDDDDDEGDDGVKLTGKDKEVVKDSSSDDDSSESEDDSEDEDDDNVAVNNNPLSKLTGNNKTAESDSGSESDDDGDDDAEKVVKNELVSKDILVNDSSSESEESSEESNVDVSENVTKSKGKTTHESDSSDSESSDSDDENDVIKTGTLAAEKSSKERDSSESKSSDDDANVDNHVSKNSIPKATQNTSKDSDSSESESSDSDVDDNNHVDKNIITKATKNTSKESDSSESESSDSDSEQESFINQSTKLTSTAATKKTLDLKPDIGSTTKKEKVNATQNDKKKEHLVGPAGGKSLKPEDVERHRLEAVKQKHKDNLKQAATVKNALANINKGSALNKKVVFDDSDDDDDGSASQVSVAKKIKTKMSKPGVGAHSSSVDSSLKKVTEVEKKPALFDSSSSSDDESSDVEEDRFAIRPQFEGSSGSKLLELQASYGNDKRFQLDKRFADEDSDDSSNERAEAVNESEEKQNALKILESVVGHKITTDTSEKKKSKNTFKDMTSLHYDPTSTAHTDMDLTKEQISQKNKKRKKETEEEMAQKSHLEGETPVETTQERFIEVSESFKDVFANKDKSDGGQTFSLLQAFGVQGGDNEDGVGAEDDAENSLLTDKDKLPLDARFLETDDKDADRDTEPMETDQADISVSAAVKEAPSLNKKKGKKLRDHVNFFFKEGDERLEAGTKFFRTEDLEEIREKWRKEKQDHIQRFKLKAKNFTRKMKKQPGQRGDGRQVDRPMKDKSNYQKNRQTQGHRQFHENKRGRRE